MPRRGVTIGEWLESIGPPPEGTIFVHSIPETIDFPYLVDLLDYVSKNPTRVAVVRNFKKEEG